MKGGCIPGKNKFKTYINNKLRWLASDINFKLLHLRCPIAHDLIKDSCPVFDDAFEINDFYHIIRSFVI